MLSCFRTVMLSCSHAPIFLLLVFLTWAPLARGLAGGEGRVLHNGGGGYFTISIGGGYFTIIIADDGLEVFSYQQISVYYSSASRSPPDQLREADKLTR